MRKAVIEADNHWNARDVRESLQTKKLSDSLSKDRLRYGDRITNNVTERIGAKFVGTHSSPQIPMTPLGIIATV